MEFFHEYFNFFLTERFENKNFQWDQMTLAKNPATL